MENPFQKIVENKQAPEVLKGKVMDDVKFIKLSLDLVDLVTIKYPTSIKDLIGLKSENQ